MSKLDKLIIILGPTASGKSEVALKLALRLRSEQAKRYGIKGAEIISADSRQIYKKMDIGTAKLTLNSKRQTLNYKSKAALRQAQGDKYKLTYNKHYCQAELVEALSNHNNKLKPIIFNNIPHYLIDIIKPNEDFSVAEYKELAIKIIRDIQNRGKIPILVGGTGLYISSIVNNIDIPKVKPNLKLRKKLEKNSPSTLLKQLKKLDPITFKTIDHKNIRRIIRALEVTISTGKPFSAQKTKGAPIFDALQIGLDMPREKLYKKIDQRVEKMFKSGLVQETKKLAKKYSWRLPSMSGIGYKETGMYLRGEITLKQAKELIKFATHSYARRQMTWFRRNKRIMWVKPDSGTGFNKIIKISKLFLNKTKA